MAIQRTIFSNTFDRIRSMRDVAPIQAFNDSIVKVSNALLEKSREIFDAAESAYNSWSEGLKDSGETQTPATPQPVEPTTLRPLAREPRFDRPTMPSAKETPQTKPETPTNYNLASFVREFEGFSPKAYSDYKQTSIGYGTRARPGETRITREEAERRLASELSASRQRVLRHAEKHNYQFTEKQLDALTSFDYNTGRLEQLTAKGTRTPEVIAKQMLLYNKAGGKVLPGLVRRRKAESSLFLSP